MILAEEQGILESEEIKKILNAMPEEEKQKTISFLEAYMKEWNEQVLKPLRLFTK